VIKVHDGASPVAGMELFLNSDHVGVSAADGSLVVPVSQTAPLHVQVSARPVDKTSAWMASVVSADLPLAYFPKPYTIDMKMHRMNFSVGSAARPGDAAQGRDNELSTEKIAAADASVPPVSEFAPSIASPTGPRASEMDLPLEVSAVVASATPNPTPPSSLPVLQPVPQQAPAEKLETGVQNLEISAVMQGKPLAGAQVFSMRKATRLPILLGTTDSSGLVKASLSAMLKMEQVLVRHPCCAPVLRPITGVGRFEVPLEKGGGVEAVVQSDAYGVSRAVSGSEVLLGDVKLDVAGALGMLVLRNEQLGGRSNLTIKNKDTLPASFDVKIPGDEKSKVLPLVRFAGMKTAPDPIVGIHERLSLSQEMSQAENAMWRKFRREFHGRFVQSQVFRPLIASDVEKLANAAKLDSDSLLRGGWEFSIINGEMDFVVEIGFQRQPSRFDVRLVNRAGSEVFRESFEWSSLVAPEKKGAEAYERFVTALPFEGTVLDVSKDVISVSMGNAKQRQIEKNQFVEIYNWTNSDPAKPRAEWVGNGRVSGFDNDIAQVYLVHKVKGFQGGIRAGMRAVRVSAEGRDKKTGERLP
jgi:hypothetical protein